MQEKQTLIDRAETLASEYEKRYHGCAQCTLAGIQEALGVEDAVVFRAATGLAAGGGLTTDGTCGAYNGAVLAMSSLFGRRRDRFDGDKEDKYRAFELARRLHNRFMDRYGSVRCGSIHERTMGRRFNLWNDGDKAAFEAAGAHSVHCPAVCGKAAAWAVDLLLHEIHRSETTLEAVQEAFHHLQEHGRR